MIGNKTKEPAIVYNTILYAASILPKGVRPINKNNKIKEASNKT